MTAKSRSETGRNRILRRVRRQRLKYITVLPSLITLLNGICGLGAICFASKGAEMGNIGHYLNKPQLTCFAMAGYMIGLAMLFDVLDGRVARMSQSTSSFGGQLDSLCDMISFGVAPAFLMLKLLELEIMPIRDANPAFGIFLNRFVWLAAAAYMSCGAIRLARYNVENKEDETAHMSFWGLPIPAAAGVVGSLVVFYQDMLPALAEKNTWPYHLGENIIICSLPFIMVGIAALMVSRIRYPHLLNQYLRGRKPFGHLIRIGLFLVLIILNFEAAMVLISCGFALSGFLRWFYYRVLSRKRLHESAGEAPVLTITNPLDEPTNDSETGLADK
ncbi:MAG: phosphatidylcholine/phosphatidylserine synthase [Planctomycetota bacterium]